MTNITNFLEGDLFAWYTSVWSEPIEKLVRDMVAKLDQYNPGTLSENPVTSRDLLKNLYQQLFPKSGRHDLGEYYTPDWLAEHVLNELGYEGDPDKRLLDPACGSGTFLVMTINRVKKWFEANREKCSYDEGELCQKILAPRRRLADAQPFAYVLRRTAAWLCGRILRERSTPWRTLRHTVIVAAWRRGGAIWIVRGRGVGAFPGAFPRLLFSRHSRGHRLAARP